MIMRARCFLPVSIVLNATLIWPGLAHASLSQGVPATDICDFLAPTEPDAHTPPVDCGESQDTGYTKGNPFPITVVHIDGKPVEKDTANAYWVMREVAANDGVDIHIVSGFRTYAEQQYLYNCYINCNCNNCNLAAPPGYSNHQSGHALDLNTSAPGVYSWLSSHGGSFGFTKTVPSENWHWEWWGGGPGGGICDITAPPNGSVDQADCGLIRGWAQDPDHPDTPIQVHVYFGGPAGDPNAVGVSVLADIYREDLCQPLGSCAHAFEVEIPASLRDGGIHPIHVYGIDLDGDGNPQIGINEEFSCSLPALPGGVRRHVSTQTVVSQWGFDLFWQRYMVDDTMLATWDEWVALEPSPELVKAAELPGVWLLDTGVRRHVPNTSVATAWGLDLSSAVEWPLGQLLEVPEGTALRPKPVLVQGPSAAVYLVDDPQAQPAAPDDGTDSGEMTTTSTSTTEDSDTEVVETTGGSSDDPPSALPPDFGDTSFQVEGEGCTCTSMTDSEGRTGALLLLLALGMLRRRRAWLPAMTVGLTSLGGCGDSADTSEVDALESSTTETSATTSQASTVSSGDANSESSEGMTCDDPKAWFLDHDRDGYGVAESSMTACEAPEGYVEQAGDCDDTNVHINPGALEDCNDRDDDCDELVDEASSINAQCGACWTFEDGSHTYWVCETPVTWEEANTRCLAYGAQLVSVQSSEENTLLHSYAYKGVNLFLGINDIASESEFIWTDGAPVSFTNWSEGEPNDSGMAEDCGELRGTTGEWNDISCDAARYFACKALVTPPSV